SDGNSPSFTRNGVQTAKNSYGNNMGVSRSFSGTFDGPCYMVDTLSYGPIITFATITDGTSNTALWSEYVRGNGAAAGSIKSGLNAVFLATASFSPSPPTPARAASMQQTLQNAKALCTRQMQASYDLKGYNWMDGWSGGGGPYTHLMGPNQPACAYSNDGGL